MRGEESACVEVTHTSGTGRRQEADATSIAGAVFSIGTGGGGVGVAVSNGQPVGVPLNG